MIGLARILSIYAVQVDTSEECWFKRMHQWSYLF